MCQGLIPHEKIGETPHSFSGVLTLVVCSGPMAGCDQDRVDTMHCFTKVIRCMAAFLLCGEEIRNMKQRLGDIRSPKFVSSHNCDFPRATRSTFCADAKPAFRSHCHVDFRTKSSPKHAHKNLVRPRASHRLMSVTIHWISWDFSWFLRTYLSALSFCGYIALEYFELASGD